MKDQLEQTENLILRANEKSNWRDFFDIIFTSFQNVHILFMLKVCNNMKNFVSPSYTTSSINYVSQAFPPKRLDSTIDNFYLCIFQFIANPSSLFPCIIKFHGDNLLLKPTTPLKCLLVMFGPCNIGYMFFLYQF